jgi:hypothetical protein
MSLSDKKRPGPEKWFPTPGDRYFRPDITKADWDRMSKEERDAFVHQLAKSLVQEMRAAKK